MAAQGKVSRLDFGMNSHSHSFQILYCIENKQTALHSNGISPVFRVEQW